MELEVGTVVAERFRLEREIGKGAMGSVWLAHHVALEIPCAVKFILGKSTDNPEACVRFEREAKAAAQLRSPYVVQILDYGIYQDVPYLAMEHLEGESLRDRLRDQKRLGAEETFRIIAQTGRALGKAHRAGIVHRDLKPANIFLVDDDDEGSIAKVLDFGVAKETAGPGSAVSATKTGALLGTPSFMSPEQAQGDKSVDFRSDLWALGVLAYRCLTGELPFKEQALVDLLIAIVTGPSPVPSEVAPGVPEGFDAWWAKASQRDPAERFQSAGDQIEALGVALGLSQPSMLDQSVPLPGLEDHVRSSAQAAEPVADSLASTAEWRREASPGLQGPVPGAGASDGAPAWVDRSAGGTVGAVLKQPSVRPAARRTALWLAIAGLVLASLVTVLLVREPLGGGSSAPETDADAAGQAGGAAASSDDESTPDEAADPAEPETPAEPPGPSVPDAGSAPPPAPVAPQAGQGRLPSKPAPTPSVPVAPKPTAPSDRIGF